MENFPFGEPVLKVEQKDRTPKKVFILGVYASAVHAKWISSEGKTLINALAVASEPYIFWRGDDAEKIISGIKLPKEAGKLISARKKFNGPSGNALDNEYLIPLGLNDRSQCWLCDLVPYSMLNEKQQIALNKKEHLFTKFNLKKHNMKSANLESRKIDASRRKEIVDEIRNSKAEYLITLGNEPLTNFVKAFNPQIGSLNQKEAYGIINNVVIDKTPIKLIALVHPRQSGKLGGFSIDWYNIHTRWKTTGAVGLKKEL